MPASKTQRILVSFIFRCLIKIFYKIWNVIILFVNVFWFGCFTVQYLSRELFR